MIPILGTYYKLVIDDELLESKEQLGEIDFKNKIICLTSNKEALLHEIIHAYLYESGLELWADNEDLVNWIELQFFKVLNTYETYSNK